MRIALGCDEAAYKLKEQVKIYLDREKHEVVDVGVYDETPSLYPDIAERLTNEIINGNCEKGILMCGTGIGMAITANKVPGIRAAVGHDLFSIERSVKSNNCQVLCLGARIIAYHYAERLIESWLNLEFSGGPSLEKVRRIMEIEKKYAK